MITRLALADFRSYADAAIEPGPGFVVLTGANGAGKTNILEAVSLLAPGRGLRGAALPELAREHGAGGFAVAAQTAGVQLGTGTTAAHPARRVARINGASAPIAALADWVSLVWLTPAQDRLFADPAGERRRFLDRLVVALEPGHAHHAGRYEAAMRQRNRLLAEGRDDRAWLDALEAAMAEHGRELAAGRARLVDALSAHLAALDDDAFPRAALALGDSGDADLALTLRRNRALDMAARRTLAGPHRQDLIVTHEAKQRPAGQGSTGEQKALLLGIVLAHAALVADARGRPPLILLDEIAAHLDPERRAALFERLAATGSQIWLTGTEPAPFAAIAAPASRYRVADGTITPAAA